MDSKSDVTYNDKKLIELLKDRLRKKNYSECIELMRHLGHVLLESAGKEAEQINTYKELFQIVRTSIFPLREESLLSLRIVSLRVLTNAVLALAKQDMANARTAYAIILLEIEKEVSKDKPAVAFLISILDSIAVCASANSCPDDRKTVDCLLKLEGLEKKVKKCNKKSLALALDWDLDPFVKNYSVGQEAKHLNRVLASFGCLTYVQESQAVGMSVNVPKPQPIPTDSRIWTHDMLMKLTPDQLADLVMQGFSKFQVMEGYVIPEAAEDLIQRLLGDEEFEPVDTSQNLITTATFIIDQALEKMTQRAKFVPIAVQAQFIAMLINTLDISYDGFQEAKGPATISAIRRAVDPETAMIPFLSAWACYELGRNTEGRYENLLNEICTSIASQTAKDNDNPMRDFIITLPLIPDPIFQRLADLCREQPEQSMHILNAVNEFFTQAPCARDSFLEPLLGLCINELEIVNGHAIHILRESFYKYEKFKDSINQFAKEKLQYAVENEKDIHATAILRMFFSVMELNASLFLTIMENYGKASPDMKSQLRNGIEATIPKMSFDKGVVRAALDMVSNEMKNVVVMHFYLSQLATTLSVLPVEFVDMLKSQFLKVDDARYLIPIIPSLSRDEFIEYLPKILMMKPNAQQAAIKSLLQAGQPLRPALFLVELHRIAEDSDDPKKQQLFEKAVSAMKFYFQQTDIITYESSIQAVEAIVRRGIHHDMIVETLLQMIDTFRTSLKYIVIHILPSLINRQVYKKKRQWEAMKQIFEKTKPLSFKYIVTLLPPDYISDFVATYPDLRQMIINQANQQNKPHVVELLTKAEVGGAPQ